MQSLDDGSAHNSTPIDSSVPSMPEASHDVEEERRRTHFKDLFRDSEARLSLLFAEDGSYNRDALDALRRPSLTPAATALPAPATDHAPLQEPPAKKAKRVIDEDDYGDDDEDEEDDAEEASDASKPKTAAPNGMLPSPSKSGSSPVRSVSSPGKLVDKAKQTDAPQLDQAKSEEDTRKQLEEARNATEEAARRSFHTLIYPLENDRTAMLEQQQLEESEKQLQAEMENNASSSNAAGGTENHGSLSSANLGASSLTLKHLIARIDLKRDQVRASDAELRTLMNEVRKNRSKWASEENVNQEELYEALDKVLTELKAHTEYSTPFLQRVNKRDVPDYHLCK